MVRSKHRVKTYGEVLTPRHMVDRMLDLVREELETGADFVDKTFLEPAAGDGNFLVAILHRKLRAVERRYPREEWPETSLFALASIYGIELLEDNHRDAKELMLAEFVGFHERHGVPCGPDTDLQRAAAFLIGTNIVRGNTLTGRTPNGEDIQFSWWHRIDGKPGQTRSAPSRQSKRRSSVRTPSTTSPAGTSSTRTCPCRCTFATARRVNNKEILRRARVAMKEAGRVDYAQPACAWLWCQFRRCPPVWVNVASVPGEPEPQPTRPRYRTRPSTPQLASDGPARRRGVTACLATTVRIRGTRRS